MATYRAKDRYARLTKESAWGTYDAAGNVLYPVLVGDDGLNMVRSPGQNILETNIGHGRPYYVNGGVNEISGTLNTLVAAPDTSGSPGPVADVTDLLGWGSDISSNDLDSYTIDIAGGVRTGNADDPPTPVKRWRGVKVASMTLTSGADAGAQRLAASYSLVGKDMHDAGNFDEDDDLYTPATGWLHHQGTATLGATGSTAIDATVRDFSLTFTNNLDVGLGTGEYAQWCTYTGRQVTGSMTLQFVDEVYTDALYDISSIAVQMAYTAGVYVLTLNLHDNVKVTDCAINNSLGSVTTASVSFISLLRAASPFDTDVTISVTNS